MLIRFKHIVIEGFQSIGYAEVDLNDRGFTLVNGINNCPDDNAQSNGAGKSTCFNAICFALVGETIQGVSKNLVNINTDTGLYVELDFDVDTTQYKIIRTKDHNKYGTSVKFYVNGEDRSGKGIRDTETVLKEYLPEMSSDLIGSVIIIGQGMPQRFTSNTPSGRKEVLEKLSKSDFMIEDIKSRLTNRKIALSSQIKEKDLTINNLQGQLSVSERQLERYKNSAASIVAPDFEAINTAQKIVEEKKLELTDAQNIVTPIRNEIVALLEQQGAIGLEKAQRTSSITSGFDNLISEDKEEYYRIQSHYKSLDIEIKRLRDVKDICPTCGQKLPDVHKVDTTELEAERDQLKDSLLLYDGKIKANERARQEAVDRITKEYADKVEEIGKLIKEKKDCLAEKESLVTRIEQELSDAQTRLTRMLSDRDNYNQRVQEISDSIKQTESDIDKINTELLYNNKGRDELQSRLDVVSKMLTIATRDFRGFLLTNVIEFLNRRAKTYCVDIFGTDKISLCLDGNNLNVLYNNKMYENLSGGEQKKVDIITQLSIRDMLCQFSSFSSNIIVLDETFESLDFLGCQKVIDVIAKRLTDIESIFIVTHRSNLSLPSDSTITIVKDESGVSHIS